MDKFLNNQSEIRSAIELLPMDLTMVLMDFAKKRSHQPTVISDFRRKAILDNVEMISDMLQEMRAFLDPQISFPPQG